MPISTSQSSELTVLTTDQAQAAVKGSGIFNPYSKGAVGKKATYNEAGVVNLGKNASLVLGGGSILPKKFKGTLSFNQVTESTSDPQLISALAALANNNSSPGGTVTMTPATAPTAGPADTRPLGTRISDAIQGGLQKLRDFIYTEDTDGNKTINTNFWWALGALIVVVFLWRKLRR